MATKKPCPDICIRGIRDKSSIFQGYLLTASAYNPDFSPNVPRNDGYHATSINWKDKDSVLQFTLFHKKNDEYSYKCGVVELPKDAIRRANNFPIAKRKISYERREKEGNDYHGNILFKNSLDKKIITKISLYLALESSPVITQEHFQGD